jgi:predicted XRE-type DNA-binding protein
MNKRLTRAELERARTHARLAVIGEVTKLLERLTAEGVLNQSRIAERLGVSRQHISDLMSGPAHNNWTLDKIGELLAAMDARITKIEMRVTTEIPHSVEVYPWAEHNSPHVVVETIVTRPGGTYKKLRSDTRRADILDTKTITTPIISRDDPQYVATAAAA